MSAPSPCFPPLSKSRSTAADRMTSSPRRNTAVCVFMTASERDEGVFKFTSTEKHTQTKANTQRECNPSQ